jgi:hypothetical protein
LKELLEQDNNKKKIILRFLRNPVEIIGDSEGKVAGAKMSKMKLEGKPGD